MIKRFLLTCSILATGGVLANGASAESLEEALIKAYQSNPTLEAGRAALRSTDEEISSALSNWRPSVSLSGSAGVRVACGASAAASRHRGPAARCDGAGR